MKKLCCLTAFIFILMSCGEEEADNGTINVQMYLSSELQSASTDPEATTVNWACLVLSASETACVYYYNGEAQVDGSISSDAEAAGPGTSGFTFVEDGATLSGYEGGSHSYTSSFKTYKNGSVESESEGSGELDLYSEEGKAINWRLDFGTAGDPTTTNF